MRLMCSMCGEIKPESAFRFMKHKGRYNSYCKECERFYQRFYQRAYREKKAQELITKK